jgi:HAD superfamily hydrolase (TIGR01509 family)
MPEAPARRALVFDFDGLIADTEWPEYEAWRAVFGAAGQDLPLGDFLPAVGTPGKVDFRALLEARMGCVPDWATLDPILEERRRSGLAELRILPGVRELMIEGAAHGWRIGVASSSSRAWVQGHLRRLGLDSWVEAVRTRDNVPALKPSPEPYLLVCADLGADPLRSVAFEDSQTGVAAARAAGLQVVAVPNRLTRSQDLSAAHFVVPDLREFRLSA